MKKSGLLVALYLLLTFASGVSAGVLGFWLYSTRSVSADRRPSPEEYRKRALEEYQTRLNLTPEQYQRLVIILDNSREVFRQLQDKHRPEYQAVQQHQVDQIRALLNDTQRTEYEKIREERERARKQKQGRNPGPRVF
jgi:hypothetical protein